MCMPSPPKAAAPPPPPPPPEAAPTMFGAKNTNPLNTQSTMKTGKARLQIPLGGVTATTGLGIPNP